MLTVSEVARLFNISNRQVHDLLECGYLNVARVERTKNNGIQYLFAREEIMGLDVHSCLAEIKDLRLHNATPRRNARDFGRIRKTLDYCDAFLKRIEELPERSLLRACFFLFHLNHYAKTYADKSTYLYRIKDQVLKKMYLENDDQVEAFYLLGADRKTIWLCDDCKESARSLGISYPAYIKQEYCCPKCFVSSVEKEYYSLVEFVIQSEGIRFNFHLPRSRAVKWLKDLDQLPQSLRETGRSADQMYLYGRAISRIEEKAFPLQTVLDELEAYLCSPSAEGNR